MDKLVFKWLYASMVQDGMRKELSELYSQNYGIWGSQQPNLAGNRIRLSPGRLGEWLTDPDAAVYYAELENRIIGYAIAIRKKRKKVRNRILGDAVGRTSGLPKPRYRQAAFVFDLGTIK